MADEKELQVKIRFISDVSGVKDARKATDDIKAGNKATGDGASDADSKVKNLGKSLDNLTKITAAMAIVSGVAIKGMTQAIDAYTKNVGSTETASKRWLLANQSNEMSMVRMGRSITQQALPYMETYSKFLDKTAAFMEQNPEVVKTGVDAVGAVAGIAALGGAVKVGGLVAKGIQGVLPVGAAGSAINAAGGVGAATYGPGGAAAIAGPSVLGVLASVLGGVGVGVGVNNLLAKATGEKPIDTPVVSKFLMGLLSAISPGMAAVVSRLRSETGTSNQIGFTDTSKYGAAAMGATGAAPADPLGGNLAGKILAYAQYYRQEENALRAHLITLARANRDFQMQQEYALQDYERTKMRSNRDFARQEYQTTFEYNRQRSIAVRDFNISMVRSEQDYQKSRKRAGEDFQLQLWDIARSGDAFSYMQATRQFNLQQSRNEEDYTTQRGRQMEDFDRQQSDQADAFNIQRSFRLQNYQITLDDAQVDFDVRRAREITQRQLQIRDQDQDFQEQKRLRRQATVDTLSDMADGTTKAAALFAGFTGSMVDDMNYLADTGYRLKDYFNKLALPNIAAPQRAAGGYVDAGLYQMHANEFVLNPSTTKALEKLGGGGLTQDNVLGMIGRGRGGSVTINDHRRFDSRLSADDRQAIRRENLNMWAEMMS